MNKKLGKLEDDGREVFPRQLRKELNDMVQEISDNRRFFVRFHYKYDKYTTSNQLAVVTVDRIYVVKEV